MFDFKNMSNEDQNENNSIARNVIDDDVTAAPEMQVRGKYRNIIDDMRCLITRRYSKGEAISSISTSLALPRSTTMSICKRFSATDQTRKASMGGDRRSLLNNEQKEQICTWVDNDSLLTLKTIQSMVIERLGVQCSLSTVDRVLREFHFTVKRAYAVPSPHNTDSTITKRYEYALEYRQLEETTNVDNFFFMDEFRFQVTVRTKRACALNGQSAYVFVSAPRSRNISVMSACTEQGVLYHKIRNRAFNGETFLKGSNRVETSLSGIRNQ